MIIILVPRGRAPFGQHQESRPLTRSNTSILVPRALLACGRDRELWFGPTPEVRDSRTYCQIKQIRLVENSKRILCACSELSIPATGQKDRRLWGGYDTGSPRFTDFTRHSAHAQSKADKSYRFWSQSIVFTKPFKTKMSLDLATISSPPLPEETENSGLEINLGRGCDSWC